MTIFANPTHYNCYHSALGVDRFVVLGVALIKAVSATVWVGMLLMVSIFLYAILVVRSVRYGLLRCRRVL